MFKQVLQLKFAIKIIQCTFFSVFFLQESQQGSTGHSNTSKYQFICGCTGGENDSDCENQGTKTKKVVDRHSAEFQQAVLIFSQMAGTEFKNNY